MSAGFSRRGLFSLFGRSLRGPARATKDVIETAATRSAPSTAGVESQNRVAVIQGRFCLALTSFCTVCSERCPVPGAMQVERGIPMVMPDTCTGCGVCHDVCPAPTNAVLVIPRRRNPRFPSTPPSSATA